MRKPWKWEKVNNNTNDNEDRDDDDKSLGNLACSNISSRTDKLSV